MMKMTTIAMEREQKENEFEEPDAEEDGERKEAPLKTT